MKKSILLAGIMSAALTSATMADVTVFGSVEQRLEMTDGVNDMVNDDTYVGFNVSETLGESGNSAFAVISMDIDPEGANSTATRDAYVGLDLGVVAVQAGRMTSLSQDLGDATIDIFEGNSIDVTNSSRQSNAARVSVEGAGVELSAQLVQDGSAGEKKADSYELGARAEVSGVTLGGTFTDDKVNATKTYLAGAGVSVAGVALGGTFERQDVAGVETDTLSAVASLDVAGNIVKGGYQKADGDKAWYIAELQHNFSKNTNAYVNYKIDDDDAVEDTLGLGLRMNF